jgi:hypothetical protein
VLLHIHKALQDEITTDSGLKLYIDPSYRKEWQSSVTATIVDLPLKSNSKDKSILDQLQVGDEVCISYDVVADFEFKGDGNRFMSMLEDNDYVKEFVNGKGEMIKVYALPTRSGIKDIIWVGVYQNKRRELIDGMQGTESEIERWMSQFEFGKTDLYSFNNFFSYGKKDYWKCGLDQIFAKKVKGHLVAVGDRIICKPIDEEIPDQYLIDQTGKHKVMIRHQDRGRILTGGKEKGLKRDQIISFNPTYCEKYDFYGKNYFLINQNYVEGTWS